MRGLVAPEAANNAASAGAMVPLISLGIPGSGATAVLLGALMMWGMVPGPLLIVNDPGFVWGLIASMYMGNVMLVISNIVAIPIFIKFLDIPYRHVVPVIVILCVVGAFALHKSMIETWMLIVMGVIGFGMKLYGYSPAATVLALVLGSLAENTFLQSLIIGDGSLIIFIQRPISRSLTSVLLGIIALSILLKLVRWYRAKAASKSQGGQSVIS